VALTETMVDDRQGMVAFLGVDPDPGLLDEDRLNLPQTEQPPEPAAPSPQHGRLVAAGSVLTGATLIGGVAMAIYGAAELLIGGAGAFDAVVTVVGILLAATHWGWVHVAEYLGLTIDAHEQRAADARRREWLAGIEPYPRYGVSTSVLDDASIRIQSVLYRPTLTAAHTFTFVRETDAEKTYESHTPLPRSRRCAARRAWRPTTSASSGRSPLRPTPPGSLMATTTNSAWPRSEPPPPRCLNI
jgi:hypothetical protein